MALNIENPNYRAKYVLIKENILELMQKTIEAHKLSLEAFVSNDTTLIEEVSKKIASTCKDANHIDNEIVHTLALYGAEAGELRELIADLKITNEIVRISNAAKNFSTNAKSVIVNDIDISDCNEYIRHLYKCANKSLEYCLELMQKSPKSSDFDEINAKVKIEETKTDDLYSLLEKEMMSKMSRGEIPIEYIKLLGAIRKLERVADHAVNISNLIVYAKKGGKMESY